jgi:oxygen-independent coproporphyrinogen-3 oxidase
MSSTVALDHDLLRRYQRPGPRYTSYPTAPHFSPQFTDAMLRTCIQRSNAGPAPKRLSLYVHVPYCFSPCFYCGCNRIITRDPAKGARYLDYLLREIAMMGALFDRRREAIQVHLGGGTPNFLRPEQLATLMNALGEHFSLSVASDRDFSIELDPRTVGVDEVQAYARLGFNRASLGVQDFDPTVQKAVNRQQSVEQTLAVIDACRASGFRSVNVDLIYGLPHQNLAGFARTLDTVIRARPERLAIYGYAHMPHLFRAQRRIDPAHLPDAELRLALLSLAIERLTAAGYEYIGLDHFALPDDDLVRARAAGTLQRNFMGYTTHANCDLLGLGVSAISHIGDSFSQNQREVRAWEAALDGGRLPLWRGLHLDSDDVIRAEVIQQLMCHGYIDVAAVERRFDIDFATYFVDDIERLQPLMADGLVKIERLRIAATSRGQLLLRSIAMCFDRYLHAPAAAKALYSSAV